jgi:hypothetical protein
MAFDAQIQDLVGTFTDQTAMDTWMADGAKEIINILPSDKLELCASEQTFTSGTPSTLNTSKILFVTRSDGTIDQPCREIPARLSGRASDADDMDYATDTDPVFFIKNNSIDVLPSSGSCEYSEVQFPSIDASAVSSIALFPDEAEYLVVLYTSIKALQQKMNDKNGNTDISTALIAINAELDETQIVCDLINTQVDAAVVEIAESAVQVDGDVDTALSAIATASGKVNTAIELANSQFDAGVLEATQAEVKADNAAITTALTAINTNIDSAVLEIVLANTEVIEIAAQTDNAGDFATALTAINEELDKVDEICDLANDEFDEVATQVAGSVDSPIKRARDSAVTALSINDLSIAAVPPDVPTILASTVNFSTTAPSYTSPTTTISGTAWATAYPDEYTAINIALSAITTEVGLAKIEVSEIATQTDNSSSFSTALSAMVTELDKVDSVIVEASAEFDEAKNLSGAYNSGVLKTALDALKASVLNAEDEIEDANKMVANIVLGVAEITESAVDTDTSSSEIKTAADAITTALGKFREDASDPALFGDESQYETGVGMTHVKNALENAQKLIDENLPAASYDVFDLLQSEDIELVTATLQTAQTEIQRAQTHISEWNTVVQSLSAEAQGFANEVKARGAWTSAKAQVWNGYFASAQAYAQASQAYLSSANGYANEIQSNIVTMKAFINTGNAYLQEAQGYISQANGYAQEVNARGGFTDAKYKAVSGYLETSKGYSNEVKSLLSQTTMKVAEYQAKLQDALNEFNDDSTEYKAQLQISIQNAQLEDSEEGKKLQKYSSELQQYQAEVDAEVKEYQQNLNQQIAELDSSIKIQGAYLKEAQSGVAAGNAYLQEAQSRIAQAGGYAQEVSARGGFTSAKAQAVKGYIATSNAYIQASQAFGAEVQAYLNSVNIFSKTSSNRVNLGNAFLAEANASSMEAKTYANEVNARMAQIGGYSQVVDGYIKSAQGYVNEIQSKIAISQGYAQEVQARLGVDSKEYEWYQSQQLKLQQDYDKGLKLLIGVSSNG